MVIKEIRKFIRNNKFVLIVLSLELFILILYWINDPKIIAKDFYDSVDYLDYANAFKYGPKSFFTDFRAPIYPLILFFLQIKNLSDSNFNLYVLQVGMQIISLFISWKVFQKIIKNSALRKFIFILLALGIDYFWMTKTMLSETTASMLLICLVYFSVLWLESKKIIYFIVSISFLICLIFTRPFYLYLIAVYLGIFLIESIKKQYSKKVFLKHLAIILCFVLIIFVYNSVNFKKFKYFGISTEGGINLFSRVAEYPELLPNKYDKSPQLLERAKKCRAHDRNDSFSCIWEYYPHSNIPLSRNDSFATKIEEFSKHMVLINFVPFTIKAIPYFIATTNDLYIDKGTSSTTHQQYLNWYGFEKQQPLTNFFKLFTFHQAMLHHFFTFSIFIFGIPIYIFYIFNITFSKKSDYFILLKFFLFSVIFYPIIITGYVAIGDMARMLIPTLPLIYAFSFLNFLEIKKLIKYYNRKLTKQNIPH